LAEKLTQAGPFLKYPSHQHPSARLGRLLPPTRGRVFRLLEKQQDEVGGSGSASATLPAPRVRVPTPAGPPLSFPDPAPESRAKVTAAPPRPAPCAPRRPARPSTAPAASAAHGSHSPRRLGSCSGGCARGRGRRCHCTCPRPGRGEEGGARRHCGRSRGAAPTASAPDF
jgi:hypothetical protein